jgi:mannose-1-phosphate guanylyltransferase
LQQAADRVLPLVPRNGLWVITNEAYRSETARQLPALPEDQIVGEPVGRDTAACIGLGAALIARQDSNALMIAMPADHLIEPDSEFQRAVNVAKQLVLERPHALVTFGIRPNFPATGYGYIHRQAEKMTRDGIAVYRVQQFKEKPNVESARRFLDSGEYYWNSGIFIWNVETILAALAEYQPALHGALSRIADAWQSAQRQEVFRKEYERLERISIDFAVMERAKEVLVLEAPYKWDDVGSWLALERTRSQDADGNTILAQHAGLKTHNCLVVGDRHHLITTIGVENLLIVQDGNSTLVADRSDEATVKQLVELLKKMGLESYL